MRGEKERKLRGKQEDFHEISKVWSCHRWSPGAKVSVWFKFQSPNRQCPPLFQRWIERPHWQDIAIFEPFRTVYSGFTVDGTNLKMSFRWGPYKPPNLG